MPTVVDSLIVTLGLDASAYAKGQKEAQEGLRKTRESADATAKELHEKGKLGAEFFGQIRNAAVSMFAVFTAGVGLKEFIRDVTRTDAALGRLAPNIGLTVEQLGAWKGASEVLIGNSTGIMAAVQSLSSAFFDLKTKAIPLPEGMSRALSMLHIPPSALEDTDKLLKTLGAIFQKMDPRTRTGYGKMLGFDQDMVNLLSNPNLSKALEEAKKRGPTTDEAKTSQSYIESLARLEQASSKLGRMLWDQVAPAVIFLQDKLTELADWLAQHPHLLDFAAVVTGAVAIKATASAFVVLAKALGLVDLAAAGKGITTLSGLLGLLIRAGPLLLALGILLKPSNNTPDTSEEQRLLHGGAPRPVAPTIWDQLHSYFFGPPGSPWLGTGPQNQSYQAPVMGQGVQNASYGRSGGATGGDLMAQIRRREAFSAKAYWDHKQWSIGYGTRASSGNETITREEAESRLQKEVSNAASTVDAVARSLGITLNSNQRDALTDFTFNLGGGVLRSMLSRAGRNLGAVPGLMQEYNHASGRVEGGLTARRQWEGQLFASPSAQFGGVRGGGSSQTTIGNINVYTSENTAKGIVRDIRAELTRFGFAAQANAGLA